MIEVVYYVGLSNCLPLDDNVLRTTYIYVSLISAWNRDLPWQPFIFVSLEKRTAYFFDKLMQRPCLIIQHVSLARRMSYYISWASMDSMVRYQSAAILSSSSSNRAGKKDGLTRSSRPRCTVAYVEYYCVRFSRSSLWTVKVHIIIWTPIYWLNSVL
jgi:hypothetical protein